MKKHNIVSINGTLSEEWNVEQPSCGVNIYTNGLEISTSDGTRNYEFEYLDIDSLKVDSTVEVIKKKFLFTSKVVHLKLSVGNVNMSPIIVSEKDYDNLLEGIKHEKERRERFLEEQALKNEFIQHYDSVNEFFFTARFDAREMQKKLGAKTRIYKDDIFMYLVDELYKTIGNSNSVDAVMDLRYIKKLMNQTIHFTPVRNDGTRIPDSDVRLRKYYDTVFDFLSKNVDEYIKDNIFRKGNSEFSEIMYDFAKENDIIAPFIYFMVIVMIATAFIKSLILCRKQDAFRKNEEMFKIFSNLSTELGNDFKSIADKMYPLYSNYYNSTFGKEYSIVEFYAFLKFYNNYHNNTCDVFNHFYGDELNSLKVELAENEGSLEDEPNMIFKVKSFLKKFDSRKYFDLLGRDYDVLDNNNQMVYILLYRNLLKYFGQMLPAKLFFQLLDKDTEAENEATLIKKHKEELLQKEKERLLGGDMAKEKRQKLDKYSFDNLKTGYEFEEYLKAIFEKMGHIVEVTKKSNDQGGDLVLEKNGTRTVVQAKFYNTPVGNKAVQEVVAAKSYYKAHKGMIVTNNTYTKSAIDLAEANDITLVDGDELKRMRNDIIEAL
jgi:HJR/Mrr/RecB family endonuclease